MVAMVAFIYYWIYPSSIIILIANAAIHAASTYVIYKIFFKITKNKKITFLSVLVLFFPIAVFFGFHKFIEMVYLYWEY